MARVMPSMMKNNESLPDPDFEDDFLFDVPLPGAPLAPEGPVDAPAGEMDLDVFVGES